MHGDAGRPHARQQGEVVILDVGEMRLDVEQAVLATVAVERDRTAMQPFAGNRWESQGMRQDKLFERGRRSLQNR